jgi:hypothetical protein
MTDLRQLARVDDADLDGLATGPAAGALLAQLMTEPPEPRRRPLRRLVLVATAAVVALLAAVVGPSLVPGGATSYANSAVEIHREGDFYVARIKDPLADGARFAEAFRAVGLDVDIELVPVSPKRVGMLLSSGGGGGGLRGSRAMTEVVPNGPEKVDCALDPSRCSIIIKIDADSSGWNRFKVGRPAQPGEALQDPDPSGGPRGGDGAAGGGD